MAIEMDIAAAVAQLGAAGVIGWMWLSERRGAVERERELRDSHAVVMGQRESIAALVELVRESTRVMAGLEAQQRRLEVVIERLGRGESAEGAGSGRA